ncbi:bifunctional DNA primase/helicase [Bordetella genomosp. 9]|uniref:Bifunctional DNA primase/helicase n=1 Tax=Bordetella genomosp. 9 TaxID=1416803 RepID=A0A261RPJ3_9BORD|nr:toprim domain-containing protein [Bordetella genomosp. 9]OZI26831.1 bifunctional DNA primase/helicase [Bordetella genomosp. 9]
MKPDIHREVLARLEPYGFKERAGWLRQGLCPACHKKELYTNAEHPWVLRCGRLNNCGWEGHVKELFPDIFDHWSKRYAEQQKTNPNAAADAYLVHARGFDLSKIASTYSQEHYFDRDRNIGSATVRFPVANTWWERLIDEPSRFGKQKARFKFGGSYMGEWWTPPRVDLNTVDELWLVEGIFDAIALLHVGIPAVALLSCNNYPSGALRALRDSRDSLPKLVWALDGDKAGRSYTVKHVRRARADGWTCRAALIPQGKVKRDWNDLYLLDRNAGDDTAKKHLTPDGLKAYFHHGALLLASNATEKALLIYEHDNSRTEFDFEFGKRLYWFSIDLNAYHKAMDRIAEEPGAEPMTHDELREKALRESGGIRPISNCYPQPLYFQENKLTDESWYYFRVEFPHDGAPVKNTFTASQVSTASEFKKRLLAVAPGAMFSGTAQHLDRMMERRLYNIKRVETVDFIGYSRNHGCYVLGDIAVKDGTIYRINEEDFFDIGKLSVKSLNQSVALSVNNDPHAYTSGWVNQVWTAFGAKGLVALAFWFGSLFAEQIRAIHKSYPFLEIVGEAGSGKSTLIEFLWKLVGRSDYEGFDPSKASLAARARNFSQVSGLPVVLIESDRERMGDEKTHVKSFDWDELKTAYNGRSIRARGVANGGNETYEPPFRGSIVIAQNNDVSASEAILSRIVHLNIDRAGQNAQTYAAAVALESTPTADVSGFILAATKREAQVLQIIEARTPHYHDVIKARPDVKMVRIVKCHAQMMATIDALRIVVKLTDEQHAAAIALLGDMAAERQHIINADHPIVQEFWDSFEYLNGDELPPKLNHSCNDDEIAVNLNQYVEEAVNRRQQVPNLRDLKKVLRTSRRHKFIGVKTVKSRIRTNASGASTVHCWVFRKGA